MALYEQPVVSIEVADGDSSEHRPRIDRKSRHLFCLPITDALVLSACTEGYALIDIEQVHHRFLRHRSHCLCPFKGNAFKTGSVVNGTLASLQDVIVLAKAIQVIMIETTEFFSGCNPWMIAGFT